MVLESPVGDVWMCHGCINEFRFQARSEVDNDNGVIDACMSFDSKCVNNSGGWWTGAITAMARSALYHYAMESASKQATSLAWRWDDRIVALSFLA